MLLYLSYWVLSTCVSHPLILLFVGFFFFFHWFIYLKEESNLVSAKSLTDWILRYNYFFDVNILWVLFSVFVMYFLLILYFFFALFNCFFFYSLLGFLYILVLRLIIWIGYSLFLLILKIDLWFDVSVICLWNCCVGWKCDFLGSVCLFFGCFFLWL